MTTVHFAFDAGLPAGWTNGGASPPYAWSLGSGTTPSGSCEWITGPSSGFGGSGSYLFAEASSPRQPGDLFEVTYDGSACSTLGLLIESVEFQHHMYGHDIGVLTVVDSKGGARLSLSGDQGSALSLIHISEPTRPY